MRGACAAGVVGILLCRAWAAPQAPARPAPKSAAKEAPAGAETALERQKKSVRAMQESIARQKSAVLKQDASAATWFATPPAISGLPAIPQPECDPLPEAELGPLIAAAAGSHDVKPELLRAVIHQESGFRTCAVSQKGAMGLMQIMPAVADQYQLADPFDAAQNVQTGAKYLKDLIERFGGNLKLALAAYNAGPARVNGDSVPDIAETQTYVQRILSELEQSPGAESTP